MNEQQLKDFGAHAERLVDIPDFAALDRRGHELRVRRRVGVAGALAMALAVAGVVAQTHHRPVQDEPIRPPKLHTDARPYPRHGPPALEGTYDIRPSLADRHLVAELTVPAGEWNAWVGPQNGTDGYVNALVMEIDHVNTHACLPDVETLETPRELVGALTQAASTELVRAPESVQRFGYPATRMRLRVTDDFKQCPKSAQATYHSPRDGYIPFAPPGTRLDIWVVDVDGTPIYVQRAFTPDSSHTMRKALDGIIDSITFGTR